MFGTTRRTVVLVALAALLVSSAGTAVAQSDDPEWESEVYDEFAGQIDVFNQQVGAIDLGPAGGRLAGSSANLYVEGEGGTADYSFEMDGRNRITNLQRDPVEDADLRITTSRETVREIANANNSAAKFRSAYANGDISIQADYSLGEAVSGQRGSAVKSVSNWGFWKAAGAVKGLLG